jgi:hypothetical protein
MSRGVTNGPPEIQNRLNGWPTRPLFHLSKLAVRWLRLGIGIERIKPAHPQQNGRHERMHLTLKIETTKPAALNILRQQARFDNFIEVGQFFEARVSGAIQGKRSVHGQRKELARLGSTGGSINYQEICACGGRR